MAVKIRLRRIGKNPKKRPYFRISVMDQHLNRDGRVLEEIGTYDPIKSPAQLTVKMPRYEYWISKGAVASPTVKSIVKQVKKGKG
jgi:small subunit ribosomal protein S16